MSNMHTIEWRDDYRFFRGDCYWSIQTPKQRKSGMVWKSISYHGTLAQAAKELARVLADDGDSSTLAAYVRDLEQAVNEINAGISGKGHQPKDGPTSVTGPV